MRTRGSVGGTAGQALLPYDFLTVILDNCSAMACKLSGLAVTLQELRLFSFYWLQATGVRGNMGEFFSMINEHCQRHVDEIEFTTADKAAAADEKEHGWDGVPLPVDSHGRVHPGKNQSTSLISSCLTCMNGKVRGLQQQMFRGFLAACGDMSSIVVRKQVRHGSLGMLARWFFVRRKMIKLFYQEHEQQLKKNKVVLGVVLAAMYDNESLLDFDVAMWSHDHMTTFARAMEASINMNINEKAMFNKERLSRHKAELDDDAKLEAAFNRSLESLLEQEQQHLHFCAAQAEKIKRDGKEFSARERNAAVAAAATYADNYADYPDIPALDERELKRLRCVCQAHYDKLLKHTSDSRQAETGYCLAASWVADGEDANFYTEGMFATMRNQFLTARTKLMPNVNNVILVQEYMRRHCGQAVGYQASPVTFTESWVMSGVPKRASHEQRTRGNRVQRLGEKRLHTTAVEEPLVKKRRTAQAKAAAKADANATQLGGFVTDADGCRRQLEEEELLAFWMAWDPASRADGWLADILRLQITHRNNLDLINKVPGLLAEYEKEGVFDNLPANATRDVLPLRKSNTKNDRFAKMIDKGGGVTLPGYIRCMLRAEATVAARSAIDGYPERPIPASFRGAASTSSDEAMRAARKDLDRRALYDLSDMEDGSSEEEAEDDDGLRSLWNYSDSDVEDGEEDDEMEAMLGGLDSLPSNPDMLLQQDAPDGSGSESGSAGGSEGGMSDDEQ